MPDRSASMHCPVCNKAERRPVILIDRAPLFCNFLYPTREQALQAPSGTIDLVFCDHCGHLYNAAFVQNRISYPAGYANPLHYSGRYRAYATKQAQRLLAAYGLAGRQVVDIGCGDGAFLNLLGRLGPCRGIGFEPSGNGRADRADPAGGTKIIPEPFSSRFADIEAGLYVACHVLEHLADPLSLLKTIRDASMGNGNAPFFLEVPDASFMLYHCSVWDIIYEHVSCFTAHSLAFLLNLAGFSCTAPRSVFSGQYLAVDAFPARRSAVVRSRQPDDLAPTKELLAQFQASYPSRIRRSEEMVGRALGNGRRAVVWGAGSKGIAFLNSLPAGLDIPFIIDINPGKQEKFVPGSGQQVMGPEFLADYRPETVFITNEIYAGEIGTHLARLKIAAMVCRI